MSDVFKSNKVDIAERAIKIDNLISEFKEFKELTNPGNNIEEMQEAINFIIQKLAEFEMRIEKLEKEK